MIDQQIFDNCQIKDIWTALGGPPLKHSRGIAFWRPTADDYNVSIDADANVWFDHARNEGGGVLDLICKVHNCGHADAMGWLAQHLGLKPLSDAEKKEYGRRRLDAQAEGKRLVAWREQTIAKGRQKRNLYQSAYHRSLRHVLNHLDGGPVRKCCLLAMEVCELYEQRYQNLDDSIVALEEASMPMLLEMYRRQ